MKCEQADSTRVVKEGALSPKSVPRKRQMVLSHMQKHGRENSSAQVRGRNTESVIETIVLHAKETHFL